MKEAKKLAIAFTAGALVPALFAWSLVFTAAPGDAKSTDSKAVKVNCGYLESCSK